MKPKFCTRNDNIVRFTFSVGDTTHAFYNFQVMSKTNRIGKNEYNI